MNADAASPTPDPVEEAIFHAASDLAQPARAAFLDRACGTDSALRARIETLLAADIRARQFLAADPLDLDLKTRPKPVITSPEQSADDQTGRYKLLEKIGEGGMGVVYMAEQREPVVRKVALKIIKLGMDTRQVIARFEAERQALAMMDHPHIARVLDAGATETGRPYFVMELVQGVPITQFCNANQLSVEARLKLFVSVCQAIQSAHQKGIIHRDLKPSNVLVTMHNGLPHPMVIDFGVAKATDRKLTEKTLFTNFATMIGTPAYMSPEQAEMSPASAGDVDTRSDIYSLGVLLYELLTGTTPFPEERLRSAGYGEMQRIIVEEEPERPSTRLKKIATIQSEIRNLKAQIHSDLDWIVMKCLEKDRNRRYETANGLAADLNHHFGHEPVVARPPSAVYRFQKLIRRHKLQFAAATFALAVLLLAVAVSSWQAVKAKRAERQAKEQAQLAAAQAKVASQQTALAQAAKDFLIENLLGATDEAPDADALTFEATQALARKVARRMEGKFTNQPLTEADIRMAIGKVFLQAKEFKETVSQAEKALEIRRALLPPEDTNVVAAVQRLAAGKYYLGQRKEALDLLTNAIAMARAGGRPASVALAWALNTYGTFLTWDGRPAEALLYLNESLALARRIYDPKSIDIKQGIVKIIEATRQTGDSARADVMLRDLLEQCLADHGPDHYYTAENQMALGRRLVEQQRWAEAIPLLEHALAVKRAQFGSNNFSALTTQLHLCEAYEQTGDISAAAKLYADLHPRYVKYFGYSSLNYPKYGCTEAARFFVRHRLYEEARLAFAALRAAYDAKPPELPVEFDLWVEAAAPTKGWAAVAKVYRAYPGRFERDATYQRSMASAFLYGDDREGYQQTVTNALARALTATNLDERRRFVDLVGLGHCELSSDEINLCEKLLALAGTNTLWLRPTAALLLRLGRNPEALQRLDLALQRKPSTAERARLMMLKSICLSQSREAGRARAAFDEAEALMKDRLLARLPKEEGFIDHNERAYLIHRREAEAPLPEKNPN